MVRRVTGGELKAASKEKSQGRMERASIFFSVVIVVQNNESIVADVLAEVSDVVCHLARDYEVIVVDNGSTDKTLSTLKHLTGPAGLPNVQVFALTKSVDKDIAAWAGVENALGDFIAVFDPLTDSADFLEEMLDRSLKGADVVFAANETQPPQSLPYRLGNKLFNFLYSYFNGVDLSRDAPGYRILSRRVVNFVLQHPVPAHSYRYLPATAGFARDNLRYSAQARISQLRRKTLGDSLSRGVRLLVSTTHAPMRIVTSLSLFGALANVVYTIYVILVGALKADVAPGWISLSLQQSGMFFLLSLVLFVLGEYILHVAFVSAEGPAYYIAQEFASTKITRLDRLNVETFTDAS